MTLRSVRAPDTFALGHCWFYTVHTRRLSCRHHTAAQQPSKPNTARAGSSALGGRASGCMPARPWRGAPLLPPYLALEKLSEWKAGSRRKIWGLSTLSETCLSLIQIN